MNVLSLERQILVVSQDVSFTELDWLLVLLLAGSGLDFGLLFVVEDHYLFNVVGKHIRLGLNLETKALAKVPQQRNLVHHTLKAKELLLVRERVAEACLRDLFNLTEKLGRCRSKHSRDVDFVQTLSKVAILEELFYAERLDI